MEILLPLLYIAFFTFLIFRINFFRTFGLSRRTIFLLFIVKIAAGMTLWALYTYYYTKRSDADIYKYFDDSKVMFDAIFTHPGDYFRMLFMVDSDENYFIRYYSQMNNWFGEFNTPFFNEAHTIIRMNAFVRLFSFGNYHVHTVFWCFTSLIGSLYLFRSFARYMPDMRRALVVCVFLLPSVLLWTSGVLKEGPLFLGLGIFIYSYFRLWDRIHFFKYAIQILISIFLLCSVKFYIVFCLLPGILTDCWIRLSSEKHIAWKYIFTFTFLLLLVHFTPTLFPTVNPLPNLVYKQVNFINLANGGVYLQKGEAWIYVENKNREILIPGKRDSLFTIRAGSTYHFWPGENVRDSLLIHNSSDTSVYTLLYDIKPSGSRIDIPKLEASSWSILKNSPTALFNALFRPHPGEASSPLLLLSALENLLLVLGFAFALFFFRIPDNKKLFFFCLSYVLILSVLIGLTTPVLGAIMRYKAPALPFLYTAILLLINKAKLNAKFPFLGKLI